MYSTCLFCNKPLGANAVLEEFPVGRRLAFDADKGRLWVVCRKCERWNLSPIEERWEAIEAAERVFRETRMRVSTDNIGLARHGEGLELVRIGQPMRPEFAAWRYGDQFGRRRRRAIAIGVGAGAVVGTIAVAGMVSGVLSGYVLSQSGNFVKIFTNARTVLKVPTAEGEVVKLKSPDLLGARLRHDGDGRWSVIVGKKEKERVFEGSDAERVAGLIMPKINANGARAQSVQEAVREIDRRGGPQAYLAELIRHPPRSSRRLKKGEDDAPHLGRLPTPAKLALEMALHEEQERRALEGELKALEIAWQAAEEVAAISDDLLLSDEVRSFLARAKAR